MNDLISFIPPLACGTMYLIQRRSFVEEFGSDIFKPYYIVPSKEVARQIVDRLNAEEKSFVNRVKEVFEEIKEHPSNPSKGIYRSDWPKIQNDIFIKHSIDNRKYDDSGKYCEEYYYDPICAESEFVIQEIPIINGMHNG